MFQVSHILVLSQPDFVQNQVCSVFAKGETAGPDSSSMPSPVVQAEAEPQRRKLKPRGSRLRW